MASCRKCGAESVPDARICTQCGERLTHAAPPLTKTMLGMSSPFVKSPGEAASPPKAMLGSTMIGMPSPVLKIAGSVPGASPPGPSAQPALPAEASAAQPAPPPAKFSGTLLGIAQPGLAPRDARSEVAPAPPRLTPTIGTPVSPSPHSSEASSRSTDTNSNIQENQRSESVPPSLHPSKSVRPSSAPPPSARSLWQSGLFIGLGLMAAAAVGALAATLGSKPLQIIVTQYTINQDDKDQLNLMCSGCPDGTTLLLDDSQTVVHDEKAILVTQRTIRVGRNELDFTARDPEGNSLDTRPVVLPIAYRQRASWSGLHAALPYAEVIIEAPAGSAVTIDGKATTLIDGTAKARIDLGDRTLGEASQTKPLVLAIPLSVTIDGKTRNAQATLKSSVSPLQLTSIGPVHMLGGKPVTIQGRVAANATVIVGDTKLQASAQGTFSHTLVKPRPGKLTITSFTEQLIARRVEIDLVDVAAAAPATPARYGDLQEGMTARLDASVVESRVLDGVTMTLLEMSHGCSAGPCLVRAVLAEPHPFKAGERVSISGIVRMGNPVNLRVAQVLRPVPG